MKTPYKILGTLALALTQAVAQSPGQLAPLVVTDVSHGLQVGDPVEVGQPIRAQNPTTPKEFRKKSVSVVLHATLGTDGTFKDLAVVGGEPALAGPSLDAVRQLTYSACSLGGVPIEVPVFIAFGLGGKNVIRAVETDLPFPTKPSQVEEGAEEISKVTRSGTTQPKIINAPDPEYSETARIAKYQGFATFGMTLGPDGNPRDVWVMRKLGFGLDQKAIETVRWWKFKPATRDGEPVALRTIVEVSFQHY